MCMYVYVLLIVRCNYCLLGQTTINNEMCEAFLDCDVITTTLPEILKSKRRILLSSCYYCIWILACFFFLIYLFFLSFHLRISLVSDCFKRQRQQGRKKKSALTHHFHVIAFRSFLICSISLIFF